MLILTRRPGENIVIGDDIEVAVLSVDGHKVRVGVQAPPNVPVHRKEIYLQIREQEGGPTPAGEAKDAGSPPQDRGGAVSRRIQRRR